MAYDHRDHVTNTFGEAFAFGLHVSAPVYIPGLIVIVFWVFAPLWLFLIAFVLALPFLVRAYAKSWARWKKGP